MTRQSMEPPSQSEAHPEPAAQPDRKAPHRVLFLQGLATPFYAALAAKLAKAGHTVHRVHFCGGDWAFRGKDTEHVSHHLYGGKIDELPTFYHALVEEHDIDIIIVFGDCRPVHEPAREMATELGLQFFALDEGYIRPGYITMEAYGTNGYSRMPKDPAKISTLARAAPANAPYRPIPTDMGRRVRMDLAAHAATIRHRSTFPHYRSHRPAPVWKEARGWITRGWNALAHGKENDRTLTFVTLTHQPYFLVPLQLNSDYQIRRHSRFTGGMPEFISEVMASFADHAPADAHLFFKNHPLDNGVINYRRLIRGEAKRLGLGDRVLFASGGDLGWFLEHCQGVVLCNSTVGFAAIKARTPMIALGNALYDIDGITCQQGLNAFWQNPVRPQQSLAQEFLTVVETYTQVRGDLFSDAGIDRASDEALGVITGATPRLPAD